MKNQALEPVTIDAADGSIIPDDSWKDRLTEAKATLLKRTIPPFLEFCREVYQFRLHCDSAKGGSKFTKLGTAWLGVGSSQLHAWSNVGKRAEELSDAIGKLPASEGAIAKLASLDDELFSQALNQVQPDMSQKAVSELVYELSPRHNPKGGGGSYWLKKTLKRWKKDERWYAYNELRREFILDRKSPYGDAVRKHEQDENSDVIKDPVTQATELLSGMSEQQFEQVKAWINQSVTE